MDGKLSRPRKKRAALKADFHDVEFFVRNDLEDAKVIRLTIVSKELGTIHLDMNWRNATGLAISLETPAQQLRRIEFFAKEMAKAEGREE